MKKKIKMDGEMYDYTSKAKKKGYLTFPRKYGKYIKRRMNRKIRYEDYENEEN